MKARDVLTAIDKVGQTARAVNNVTGVIALGLVVAGVVVLVRRADPAKIQLSGGRLVARQLAPEFVGVIEVDDDEPNPERANPKRSKGPARMDAHGVGAGYAWRADQSAARGELDGEGYDLGWTHEPLWLAEKEAAGPRYVKQGAGRVLLVRASAANSGEARAWLEAMAKGAAAGPKRDARDMGQRRIVYPSPPRGYRGPFWCDNKPGINAAANAACGRWPSQRAPIEIALHEAGGEYFVAVWPWGSLAAGHDPDQVIAAGEAIARGVNEHGRMVAVA